MNPLTSRAGARSALTGSRERRLLAPLALLAMVIACMHYTIFASDVLAASGESAPKSAKRVVKPQPFPSAEEGMSAFAAAASAHDLARLKTILGSDGAAILESGDPVEDKATRERFTKAYEESHRIEHRGVTGSKAWIIVGKDDWPLPIPLYKAGSVWYFDAKAGREEVINRRIGRNELSAAQAVLAYVDAQNDYYQMNPQKEPLHQYAQHFVSSEGKRDGLYFPAKAGEKPSPLGPLFDARRAKGYVPDEGGTPPPYHGYRYKILKSQGPQAAGGAYNYVVNGKMIGGFALVAYPAQYGSSGIMTFLVNHEGVIYQKNLGPRTGEIAPKITRFDPDSSWKRM
jgi:hypothetical protein